MLSVRAGLHSGKPTIIRGILGTNPRVEVEYSDRTIHHDRDVDSKRPQRASGRPSSPPPWPRNMSQVKT